MRPLFAQSPSLRDLRARRALLTLAVSTVSLGWAIGTRAADPAPNSQRTATTSAACPAILQKSFPRLQDDAPQDLCQYAGRVLLVVNTASYCGFTSQYEGLEQLHAKYSGQGLTVLGFPTNDFGQQEPGNNQQIADFCFNTYGVKFPMFAKTEVVGKQTNALYRDLLKASGKAPQWNFHKYLLDRSGKVIASYPSETTPDSPRLLADLQRALSAR
jgi:glutathione peroxidase